MKKLLLFLSLFPLFATAQITPAQDTTLITGSAAFTPQSRYTNVTLSGVNYRIPQIYNSLLGKYDTYITSKYLRAFYAPTVSGGYARLTGGNAFTGNQTISSGGADGLYFSYGFNTGRIWANAIASKSNSNWGLSLADSYSVLNAGTNSGLVEISIADIPKIQVTKDTVYVVKPLSALDVIATSYNQMTVLSSDSSKRIIYLSTNKNAVPALTGTDNYNMGSYGMASMTTSNRNINIGSHGLEHANGSALGEFGAGGFAINIGDHGQFNTTTGIGNHNIGQSGQLHITTGSGNQNNGYNGQRWLTTGYDNTNDGTEGQENMEGASARNTGFGAQNLYGNPDSTIKYTSYGNTAVGWNAGSRLKNTLAGYNRGNTFIGHAAGSNARQTEFSIVIGANVGVMDSTSNVAQLNIGNMLWARGIYGSVGTGTGIPGIDAITNHTPVTNGTSGSWSPWFAPEFRPTTRPAGVFTDSLTVLSGGKLQFIAGATTANSASRIVARDANGAIASGVVNVTNSPISGVGLYIDGLAYGGNKWGISDGAYTANGKYEIDDITNSKAMISITKNTGAVQFNQYGAGAATFDASGNITSVSDRRLKDSIGVYSAGLSKILKLKPVIFKYNKLSGLETEHEYAGFFAQNVKANLPLSTGQNAAGFLSLQDRAIMAALVNSVKELQAEIVQLKKQIKRK